MDWMLHALGPVFDSAYVQTLIGPDLVKYLIMVTVVMKTVGGHFKTMASEVKQVRLEIHDFKDIFKAENRKIDKRVCEVEGKYETLTYEVYELKTNLKTKEA